VAPNRHGATSARRGALRLPIRLWLDGSTLAWVERQAAAAGVEPGEFARQRLALFLREGEEQTRRVRLAVREVDRTTWLLEQIAFDMFGAEEFDRIRAEAAAWASARAAEIIEETYVEAAVLGAPVGRPA